LHRAAAWAIQNPTGPGDHPPGFSAKTRKLGRERPEFLEDFRGLTGSKDIESYGIDLVNLENTGLVCD